MIPIVMTYFRPPSWWTMAQVSIIRLNLERLSPIFIIFINIEIFDSFIHLIRSPPNPSDDLLKEAVTSFS